MHGLGLVALLLVGLALAIAWLSVFTYFRMTRPLRRTYASALSQGRPGDPGELHSSRAFSSWTLTHTDSRGTTQLPVWDIPGDGGPHAPVVIFSHGWGDSRIGALTRVEPLLALASRCVLWDMPGHGDAPGATSLGLREPAMLTQLIEEVAGRSKAGSNASDATASHALENHALPPIVLLGWSLGAGVSIAAAANNPRVALVIAEAPYRMPQTPAKNVHTLFGLPWRINLPVAMWVVGALHGDFRGAWLRDSAHAAPQTPSSAQPFDRTALARTLTCPLLVLHGEQDSISPLVDGESIAHAAPKGELVRIAGGGHHSLWTQEPQRTQCISAVSSALRAVTPRGV